MANSHMKICSPLLTIREPQIKTKRYHLTPARIAIIWKSTNNNAVEGEERREPFYTVGGNVNGTVTMENSRKFP